MFLCYNGPVYSRPGRYCLMYICKKVNKNNFTCKKNIPAHSGVNLYGYMKTQTPKATNPTEYATLSLNGFVAWRWRAGGGGDGGQEGEVGGEMGGEGEKV